MGKCKYCVISAEPAVSGHTVVTLAWFNFCRETNEEWDGEQDLDKVLYKYNARNVPCSDFIEFDSKEDMLMFVLRWS